MKHFLELIPIYARVHKKQNRMTQICIMLAVFLVTAIFSMADMEIRSQYLQTIQTDGNWHAVYSGINSKQAALISARPEVNAVSWYDVLNYGLDEAYKMQNERIIICGLDQDFFELQPALTLVEGSFPDTDKKVILSQNAKEKLDVVLGSQVTIDLQDGTQAEMTISGFTDNASLLSKADAVGVFVNMEAFDELAPVEQQAKHVFYVQYSSSCNIPKVIEETREQLGLQDEQIGENAKLLGVMGMSSDSYIMQLYGVAAVLAVLVITAGILMIASNLNSNVARKTEFFGLMRCLGATPKQIKHFVRLEALNWCKTAVPIGVAGGIAITWLLCTILRLTSPKYFAELLVWGVSLMGIILGAVVGVVTVLIAASSPAKRAAAVSPLTAVSGNTGLSEKIKKGANLKLHTIETALGIRHAGASKKNFCLMVGSFAFSIILFLAFTTAIDFMNHALHPLQPYTPDVSIISSDNTCSIGIDNLKQLQKEPSVKRVYGRMFAYGVPTTVEGREVSINLISYEENQFGWAEKALASGELESVMNGDSVLTVYDKNNSLKTGDVLQSDLLGEMQIAGVLEHCPFSRDEGIETIICSEETFRKLTGEKGYTILDIQLEKSATDEDIAAIRNIAPKECNFSDQRQGNREVKSAFYSFSIFVYGFLTIIALISIFNIINSIAMSVSARIGQYGTMRAIGMSDRQVLQMIAAEAATYSLYGIIIGLICGVPINRFLFTNMITSYWGDAWYVPIGAMLIIVLVITASTVLAIIGPSRRIKEMTIVDTIRGE